MEDKEEKEKDKSELEQLMYSLYIMDTLVQESCSVIQRCPLCGGYFIQ